MEGDTAPASVQIRPLRRVLVKDWFLFPVILEVAE